MTIECRQREPYPDIVWVTFFIRVGAGCAATRLGSMRRLPESSARAVGTVGSIHDRGVERRLMHSSPQTFSAAHPAAARHRRQVRGGAGADIPWVGERPLAPRRGLPCLASLSRTHSLETKRIHSAAPLSDATPQHPLYEFLVIERFRHIVAFAQVEVRDGAGTIVALGRITHAVVPGASSPTSRSEPIRSTPAQPTGRPAHPDHRGCVGE